MSVNPLSPSAIAASNNALPRVVPATVVSAARTPRVAPVEMTRVTIGPGTMIRTTVIRRKAVKSSIFILELRSRILNPGRGPEQPDRERDAEGDDGELQELLVDASQHQGAGPAAERGADRGDERLQPMHVLGKDEDRHRRGVDDASENVLRAPALRTARPIMVSAAIIKRPMPPPK